MKSFSFIFLAVLVSSFAFSQKAKEYNAHLKKFRQQYVLEHEVVKKDDKRYFRFFEPDSNFRVVTDFERIIDTVGFMMPTSSGMKKKFFVYGKVKFILNKKPFQLHVYQSEKLMKDEKLKDHLFIPFTDKTTGEESYGAGRYIDLLITDLEQDNFFLDFNKAYNPYCAYATGYNCPIPPRQNYINLAIRAGEKNFGKQ